MTSLSDFFGLDGCEVTNLRREGGTNVIDAVVTGGDPPRCERCGRERMWRHGKRTRRVSHGPIGRTPLDVLLTFDRWRCPDCGCTCTPEMRVVERRARLTNMLKEYIAHMMQVFQGAVARVARLFGLSWGAVWRVLLKVKPSMPLRVRNVCIDEVLFEGPRGFATALCDADTSCVLGMEKGRGMKPAEVLLLSLPRDVRRHVRTLATDFTKGHRNAAYRMLPKVEVAADRFHLQRLATKALRETPEENREGVAAHLHEFREILVEGGSRGKEKLDAWLSSTLHAEAAFGKFRELVGDWRHEIDTYLTTRRSNGVAEAVNRRIGLIRRTGFGYTNFANFVWRIILANPPLHHES